MSLEKVADEIIAQAKQEAEKIKADAGREAEKIILSAKNTIEEKRNLAEAETAGILEALSKKDLASAKLEEKRLILDAKKDAIEKAHAGLLEKIRGLDTKAGEKVYLKFIGLARAELEPAYVYARDEDAALVKKIAKGLEVRKENILGGLIFETCDKKVRIDMSFDNIVSGVKSKHIKAVSKILFGEGA